MTSPVFDLEPNFRGHPGLKVLHWEGGEFMLSVYFADLRAFLAHAVPEECGQGLSEYALILFLVAIVAIAALTLLGHQITSVLSAVANAI
jgi:Flp pilus assembly pilin Flp